MGKSKAWESKSDYKREKKYWNNGPRKQRSPAGYERFKQREAAYLDRRAEEKARKESRSNRRQAPRSERGPDNSRYFDANRQTGEYSDIKNALRIDTRAGFDAAEELRNRGISTSNGSSLTDALQQMRAGGLSNSRSSFPYESMDFTDDQRRIAQLIGIRSLDSQNDLDKINRLQQGAAALGLRRLDSQNDLAKIEQYYQENPNAWTPPGDEQPSGGDDYSWIDQPVTVNPIADYIPQSDPFADQMAELQAAYNNQLAELQGQQSFFNQQLSTANAARADAENRANNMRNAFVPQANPTALSAAYGDDRSSTRQRNNNQLSDLSILSGLGTTSNPLAGLQLA